MKTESEFPIKCDRLGRVLIGEVQRIVGCSRWTLRRKIKAGLVPASISGRRKGEKAIWSAADLLAYALAQPGFENR